MMLWDWWSDTFTVWSMLILLWVGTPAQFLFVGLYFTRKWRKYKFSRAIMWKSGALALYLYASWSKVMVAGLRPVDWPWWIDLQTPIINAVVLWAITNQLWALFVDIRSGTDNAAETEVQSKADQE